MTSLDHLICDRSLTVFPILLEIHVVLLYSSHTLVYCWNFHIFWIMIPVLFGHPHSCVQLDSLSLSLFLYGPFPFLVILYSRSLILVEKKKVNFRYVKSAKESITLKINKEKDKNELKREREGILINGQIIKTVLNNLNYEQPLGSIIKLTGS